MHELGPWPGPGTGPTEARVRHTVLVTRALAPVPGASVGPLPLRPSIGEQDRRVRTRGPSI